MILGGTGLPTRGPRSTGRETRATLVAAPPRQAQLSVPFVTCEKDRKSATMASAVS